MDGNLYTLPLPESATFDQYCGGNLGGSNETCVSFAVIPGGESSFALRDSKPEGAGKELRFTEEELNAFAVGWVKKQGLTV